jgi:hypothetical protein
MAKKSATKLSWTEKELEDWLLQNPVLPSGENVVIVDKEEPGERVPDLVALDSDANLLIIEVKSKDATRTAIGQSLEYLSQFERITFEDINNNYIDRDKESLADKLKVHFGKELSKLGERRRVYLIAPSFAPASIICAGYLSQQFRHPVQFCLLKADKLSDDPIKFALSEPPPIRLEHTRDLPRGFSKSLSGNLFYIIEAGSKPILWKIGKYLPPGKIRRVGQGVLKKSLSSKGRWLSPISPESVKDAVDVSGMGTWWRKKDKSGDVARLLGVIRGNHSEVAILVRRRKATYRLQKKLLKQLKSEWMKTDIPLPDWRELIGLLLK